MNDMLSELGKVEKGYLFKDEEKKAWAAINEAEKEEAKRLIEKATDDDAAME